MSADYEIHKEFDTFFDNCLDIGSNTIYLGSTYATWEDEENGVDFDTAGKFIKSLHILENKTEGDIVIILNNPGGDEFHMFAIYDAIKCSARHITIECFGHGMSAASVILQAGTRRLLSPNCYLMIHDGTFGYYGHPKDLERWATAGKEIRRQIYKIYREKMKEKNPKITIKNIEEMCNHDTILTAQQAVYIGLADGIIKHDGHKVKKRRKVRR